MPNSPGGDNGFLPDSPNEDNGPSPDSSNGDTPGNPNPDATEDIFSTLLKLCQVKASETGVGNTDTSNSHASDTGTSNSDASDTDTAGREAFQTLSDRIRELIAFKQNTSKEFWQDHGSEFMSTWVKQTAQADKIRQHFVPVSQSQQAQLDSQQTIAQRAQQTDSDPDNLQTIVQQAGQDYRQMKAHEAQQSLEAYRSEGSGQETGTTVETGTSTSTETREVTNEANNNSPPLHPWGPSQCDAPRPWGVYFQDSGTPQMEALVELHDNIAFYLVIILFGVGWLLLTIVNKFGNMASPLPQKFASHGTSVEIIWTVTPAIILILIAFPSFKLLYLMDEISDPAMVILAEGHQWYWSYQYTDFINNDDEFIEFDSYLVPEPDLQDGALRMLEVDNRLIIPELTHIRFVVGGADVIHSLACPALGLKCDAYPGRLNQTSVMVNRPSTFYGQCSEICGILHSSMPVVVESVPVEKFVKWLIQQ